MSNKQRINDNKLIIGVIKIETGLKPKILSHIKEKEMMRINSAKENRIGNKLFACFRNGILAKSSQPIK